MHSRKYSWWWRSSRWNITSKILGVKLEHECFPLYQTRVSNYNEGTCDESGFISGSWCCYSELTATGGKIQRDRDLAVKLGNHELEIGLGLVAVGLAFYSISGKNNKYF